MVLKWALVTCAHQSCYSGDFSNEWPLMITWNLAIRIWKANFYLKVLEVWLFREIVWYASQDSSSFCSDILKIKGKKLTFSKLNMTDWMMQGANQNTKLHVGFNDSHCTGFFISNYSYALTKHFNYQATRALRHFGSYSRYWRSVVKQSVEPISIIHLFFRMIPSKCWFLLTSNDLQ